MKSLTTHKLDKAWKKFHVLRWTPLPAADTSNLNKDFAGCLQKERAALSEIPRISQKFPTKRPKHQST